MKLTHKKNFITSMMILVVVSLLLASTPKIITYHTQKDFEKGTPKGVSINSRGEIRLAPAIVEIFKPDLPFIWSGVGDKRGNVFVSGGNTGQVFKLDAKNNSSVIFDIEDLEIYAMAVNQQNDLYIGTSPQGKVYKIARSGNANLDEALFFDPEEVYIWSMAVDDQNNLYVATGEKGNIYKIDSRGNSSLFYASEDTHIRKIILDRHQNIIAGTSDHGKVIRIDSNGKAFVLYDSPLVEITDLLSDRSGNIFAGAVGESRIQKVPQVTQPSQAGAIKQTAEATPVENKIMDLPVQNISVGRTPRFGKKNSELYRIEPDGTVKTYWSSTKDQIYAMILDNSDHIVLGTGEPGRLYSITAVDEHTLLTELDELQITSLGKDANGKIIVCTSNTGKVYRLTTDFNSKGEYLSEVIDASVSSHWGAINWEAHLNEKTEIVFSTRTGNTEEPDKTWSPWSENYTHFTGQPITSPPARFIQLKATLSTKNSQNSPVLKEITFSYLQKNIAPQIKEITIHPPGDFYPESTNHVAMDSHLGNGNSSNKSRGQNQIPGHKTFRKGFRSVSWKTQDDNGDQLSFDLYYKGEDENSWKTLVKDFRGFAYSWDSELFPDGRYFIKITAKDALSNPPAMALSSEKVSPPFKVDNTGPQVSTVKVQANKNTTKILFMVTDAMMTIKTVEYGLNAEQWKLVYPVDGICDSKTEKFEITIESYIKGANTIVIKAKDALDNIGFGKTNIKL